MRIVNPRTGLLALAALVGWLSANPTRGQYATYPQPAAQPGYGQPMQQPHTTFAPAATQQAPMTSQIIGQSYSAAPQQSNAQYAAPTAQQSQQQAYAPAVQQQPYATATAQTTQPRQAAPSYAAAGSAQSVYQVAQRPAAPMSVSPQTLPQQVYNPQQPPQPSALAQGYNPAPSATAVNRYATAPAATVPVTSPAPAYSQRAPAYSYSTPYAPPRVAMAFQPQGVSADNLQLTPQAEEVTPAPENEATAATPVVPADAYPALDPNAAAATGAAPSADCHCQSGGYESYPPYGYNGAPYGACNTYSTYGYDQPGMMARLLGRHGGGYWFGGAYGLLMDRDSSNTYPLAFAASGMAPGDYPTPTDVVMTTDDVDGDFQGGVEFRFGRTFGGFAADPCGYGCNCGPKWAVESVYWELFESSEYAAYPYDSSLRTYSMMPMRGLMYNGLTVHEFWDYGLPVAATTINVLAVHSRSSFEARNVELNLLRLSICGDACAGPAMCNVGCEDGSCETCPTGQCSAGACGAEGYGYGLGRGRFAQRFSCTGVCGVRYLELDESFMYGVDYYNTGNTTYGFLDYWANTENKLVGFQLGCNGMYRIGCKWGLHMNSLVGLYGNDIDVRQYFVTSGGQVTYTTGENFDLNASKTDVSMLGELRVGASYQANCHCRIYGGWRAMGITGLALSTSQTPAAFLDATQMSNYVNSNGSMILHGLQTGVEWNY